VIGATFLHCNRRMNDAVCGKLLLIRMTMWKSQSVQLVWFLSSVENVRASKVFEELTGSEPLSYQSNRVPNPTNPFLGVANGPHEGFEFSVQIQPGRMDLVLTPTMEGQENVEGLLLVETEKAVRTAVAAAANVGDISPVRLALIINLFEPSESLSVSRALIEERIGFSPNIGEYSDLVFQINRRKQLASPEIEINRLLRYGSITLQTFSVSFQPGGVPSPVTIAQFGASLMVDINTIIDGRTFSKADTDTIFSQIAGEALRIAASGTTGSLES